MRIIEQGRVTNLFNLASVIILLSSSGLFQALAHSKHVKGSLLRNSDGYVQISLRTINLK